ncbi:MAG: RimK family alpha-L-glutamate ligase, partial [Clostridia bacterium]
MTNAWLIKNEYYTSARLDQQFAMLTQSFLARGIALTIKTNAEFCFPLGESITDDMPAFAIMWDKDIILARRLQSFGIRLFNSADAIATCDDKTLMQLAFEKCNLPTPKTIIAPMTYDNIGYTNLDFLSTVAANIGFPLVIIEAKSSYGLGVYKADTLQQAEQILKKTSYPIIFQQFVQTSFGRDIRVNVIGDEVVCAVQRLN